MKTNMKRSSLFSSASAKSKRAFTLVETMIAATIFTTVIAALFSTVFAALKIYYITNDYLDVGGQSRRLIDDMIINGTFANINETLPTDCRDLTVFNDITDLTAVTPGKRGDALMFFKRSSSDTVGNIDSFVCYYLKRTPTGATGSGPVAVYRRIGTVATSPTADPATALGTYPHPADRQVSNTAMSTTLPRSAVSNRAGIFTNDGALTSGRSPTVLVNLPASMVARAPGLSANSNVTIAISPRH